MKPVILSLLLLTAGVCQSQISQGEHPAEAAPIRQLIDSADFYLYNAPDKSFDFAKQGLALAKKKKFKHLEALCYKWMGSAKTHEGSLSKSIEYLMLSKQLADSLGLRELSITNSGNLGINFYLAGLNTLSIKYFLESSDYFLQNNDLRLYFIYRNNLAKAYADMDELDSAQKYYDEALKYLPEDKRFLPMTLFNLAELAHKQREINKTDSLLISSLKTGAEINDKRGLCNSLRLQAEILLKTGQKTQALKNALSALGLAKEMKNKELLEATHRTLAQVYDSIEKIDSAYFHLNEATNFHIELQGFQIQEQLQILRFTEQQEKIKQLQVEKEINEAKAEGRDKIIIWMSSFILVTLTLLVFLFLSRRKIIRQRKDLEKLSDFKTMVLGILSHDLRSPIATTKGVVDILLEEANLDEMHRMLTKNLSNNLKTTISMLDSMLFWTKKHLSTSDLIISSIDLPELTSQIGEDLSLALSKKDMKLNSDLRITKLHSDADMLRIILRNLLQNAIKFSQPNSHVDILSSESRKHISISVVDHGTGMTPEQVKNLFGEKTEKTRGTSGEIGSGIGLKLCKNFIDQLGGKLEIKSTPNEGSTFTIHLPK